MSTGHGAGGAGAAGRDAAPVSASVSVAMATYNGSRFIRQQLDSIAAQSVLPAELVVTDDASTDNTIAIVRAFAETAPFPVRIHENATRLGYRANFMSNVVLCASEIVALCDQDDVWDPVKLERCLETFADPEVLLCFHEAWLIDSQNRRGGLAEIYRPPAINPPLSLFPMRNPFGFAMLFRRDLLDFSDLWDRSVDDLESGNRMAHDQWLFFLASVFGTIRFVDEPLTGYRQHENNTYGLGRVKVPFLRRLAVTIDHSSTHLIRFSAAALARADILDALESRTTARWWARARTASANYRRFSWRCSLRASVYNSAGIPGRLGAWRHMILRGGYTSKDRWRFRRRGALRDLVYLFVPHWFIGTVAKTQNDKHKAGREDVGADLKNSRG